MDNMIRFSCNACGKKLKAPPEVAGRAAKCSCGASYRVPGDVAERNREKPSTEPKPARSRGRKRRDDEDDELPDDSAERGRGVSAGSKGLIAVLVFGALILLRLSIRHGFPIWIAIPLGVTMLVSMVAGLTWSVIGIVRKRGELSGTLGLLLGLGLFAWLCFLMK